MTNREKYKWNPVYNLVMEIKDEYINKIDKNIDYCFYIENNKQITCLEYWIYKLNNPKYNSIFKILQINQYKTFVLVRYGSYADIYGGEEDNTPEELWESYDGFYQECRSIVIDLFREEIVISPFRKFFNLNENHETKLEVIKNKIKNANSVEFSNKLDGSMQCARYYFGEIIMSGSQAIDPSASWRLQEGMDMFNLRNGYYNLVCNYPDWTFIFEYISLSDSHVVKYNANQQGLYLIGARNVYNGKQMSYKDIIWFANKYNIPTTSVFDKTLDEVLKDTQKYKSNEMEGFVLNVDGFFCKIKCDDYVNMHKILSKLSSVNLIIKNIADDTIDDFISKIPEAYKEKSMKIVSAVTSYIRRTNNKVEMYYEIAPKDSKKDFMLWVDKNVPKEYNGYVKGLYLGKKINYLKTDGKTPHYKKLKDMGYSESDIGKILE